MRKALLLLIIVFTMLVGIIYVRAEENNVTAVYFYTSTCSTCQKLIPFFGDLEDKHKNFVLKKYNIMDLKNKSLLEKYSKAYKVNRYDEGIVPVIFIKSTYLTGEKAIKMQLESLIVKGDDLGTVEVKDTYENFENDIRQFLGFKMLSVFLAGLVNGINPCSMSMLLFFISLIMVRKVNIMKIGLAFSAGKFLSYLLLGTIFFGLLSTINLGWFHIILKFVMLAVILILMILNLLDFFAAKNEKYSEIRMQLPTLLRKFNHNLLKSISNVTDLRRIFGISFALGMIISLGEFLCTGQIYLTTIVTILQTSSELNFKAIVYLLVYDLAFIIPLLILTFVIYKGKEVFEVSEVIREKLHLIKLINIGIFLIFGIIVLIFF